METSYLARVDLVLCVQSMELSHRRSGKIFQNHKTALSWGELCFVLLEEVRFKKHNK